MIRYKCESDKWSCRASTVEFDPDELSYEDLVDVFSSIRNPTTKNRQGGVLYIEKEKENEGKG